MATSLTLGGLLDRFVGVFNPRAAISRVHARKALSRAYEGASRKDGWAPKRAGAGPNADFSGDASELRNRARALVHNVPYIASGLNALVANLVGTGIIPRSKSSKRAKAIDALFEQWKDECDADGRLDFYGLIAAAVRAYKQDGEVLVRFRPRRSSDGLVVPLQIQLLEIDWLDSSKNGSNGSNTIVNGIEYDAIGRVSAYWMWDKHPGELGLWGRLRTRSNPVSASNIIHFYSPARPGQGRGIPSLAPVIARVRDLQTYEDAELARKNLETRLSVLTSGDASEMSLSETSAQSQVQASGDLGELKSGSITSLPGGLKMEVVTPEAAGGYVDYIKYNLHLVAAAWDVTYEMMTGDVREVNYSSARVNQTEIRRRWEQEQWLLIIPRLCVPIWKRFIDYAELAGHARADEDYGVDWSPPKWQYINPRDDVKADLDEIAGGLSSYSEKLRMRGYRPEDVFNEMKKDVDRFREMGLLDVLVMLQKGRTLSSQTDANADSSSAKAAGK